MLGCIRDQGKGKQTAMIALTGWGQVKDREKTRAAGFDAHIVKPVEFNELMRHLSHADSTTI